MPTAQFFKLEKDKQARILAAAVKEFSTVPYNDASINRIIKTADISRGSFYLYFADKEDLLFYLLQELVEKPAVAAYQGLSRPPADIFEFGLCAFDIFSGLLETHRALLGQIFTTISFEQVQVVVARHHSKIRELSPISADDGCRRLGIDFMSIQTAEMKTAAKGVELAVLHALLHLALPCVGPSETRRELALLLDLLKRGAANC